MTASKEPQLDQRCKQDQTRLTPPSQSLLRISDSDATIGPGTHGRSLTSQLLLPSPPRDFISCVPIPPSEYHLERSDYKSYLQNLRELIEGGSQ
jgi:hypothetical protein